jgi:GGDEF domain-containing protein
MFGAGPFAGVRRATATPETVAAACGRAQTQDPGRRYCQPVLRPSLGGWSAHLAAPYFIEGTAIEVATSIGMALYPVDGNTYEDLLQRSDVAMYFDKARDAAKPSLRCDAFARS